jgi:hypothetical protein
MSFTLPPAVKLAEAIARDIEMAVKRFSRDHRYTFGAELRRHAWDVLSTANRAALRPRIRAQLLDQLEDQVDDLKLALQLGKKLQAFTSFGQFTAIYREAAELGRQVGGWHRKQQHPQGQDGQSRAAGQRANTLSSRSASRYEANP